MDLLLRFCIKGYILCNSILLLFTSDSCFSQNWNPLSTGTNGIVYSTLVVPGTINELYIAGSFTIAGGISANRIAKWNGSSWQALDNGMDGSVYALAYFQGKIIAAGEFFYAGGIPANRVARWDGNSWSALNLGTNDNVFSLAVYFNELRAGGKFTTAGGIFANRIASWNGNSWLPMGAGLNDEVYALTVFGNELIVGGRFITAGGLATNRIARWSGFWTDMGTGMDNGDVRSLTVYRGELYAGGSFTAIGGIGVNYIARWNGSNWSTLGTGTNNAVYSVYSCTSIGDILAVGGLFTNAGGIAANQVATWDGVNWGTLGSGMSGNQPNVLSFTDYSATLHAAGNFTSAGSQNVNNVALWGGIPTAPVTISPVCGAVGQSLTPLLDWSNVANASFYSLQVATDPNFNTVIINVPSIVQSQYQVTGGTLANNTTYYWHVKSNNGIGSSSYSTTCWFSTLLTGVGLYSSEIPDHFELYQNFPNPFNSSTVIRFDLPEAGEGEASRIILNIYDLTGRKISEIFNSEYKPGRYELVLNLNSLFGNKSFSSGVYLYRLTAGNFSQTNKMVLTK